MIGLAGEISKTGKSLAKTESELNRMEIYESNSN